MTSRERVLAALNHRQPDRVPVDFGATGQTGISASTLYRLRAALGFAQRPVRVIEPFQILGEVDAETRSALGSDVVGLWNRNTMFGVPNDGWKPWTMGDGTPVLMPGGFAFRTEADGSTVVFPQGDRSAAPSLRLPAGGFFFDNIDRAPPWSETDLDARRDFRDLFGVSSDEDARYLEKESRRLMTETDCAVIMNWGGGGFGDAAVVPGPWEKAPRGIRRLDDWYEAHLLHPQYLHDLFGMQAEIALKNLEILRQALGDRVQVINISGTDFGSQAGEIMSVEMYRGMYKPYHKLLNDWVHARTSWKTHFHCCGSIIRLLDDMVEAGVDVLNPVQVSAAGMDAETLKARYGGRLVFWGGGVDTQHTLPFGTPQEVREQVRERIRVFSRGGGYVFNTIHNILARTPVENIVAMLETVAEAARAMTHAAGGAGLPPDTTEGRRT
jgi:uroporphyrinogen-III decarboxylase